jgi:hypothetical protein
VFEDGGRVEYLNQRSMKQEKGGTNCIMRSLVIKFRRIRWMMHVACLAESKVLCKTVFGKPENRRPQEICTYKRG